MTRPQINGSPLVVKWDPDYDEGRVNLRHFLAQFRLPYFYPLEMGYEGPDGAMLLPESNLVGRQICPAALPLSLYRIPRPVDWPPLSWEQVMSARCVLAFEGGPGVIAIFGHWAQDGRGVTT